MKTIIEEGLGISVISRFDGVMDTFINHGITNLEFRAVKGDEPELIRHYVEVALSEKKRSGMHTPTFHLPHLDSFDLSAADENKRKAAIENQIEILKIGLPLEPKIAVLHPSAGIVSEDEAPRRKEALVKSLRELCPIFADMGVTIALENLTQISMVQTSDDMLEIMAGVGENLGICFDVNHLFKEKHSEFIEKVGDRIITMHISDNDGKVEKHYMPGDGAIDWKDLFTALHKLDYHSLMVFECQVMNEFPDSVDRLCGKWQNINEKFNQ